MANRNGIPRIKSTGVVVNGTTNVQYSFTADASFSAGYNGLVLVRIDQPIPSGTSGTLPVVFVSAAGTQAVTGYGGAAITAGDVPGTGVYLMYFDRSTGTLQALLA